MTDGHRDLRPGSRIHEVGRNMPSRVLVSELVYKLSIPYNRL
jgi:hypothetical protein